MLKIRGRDSLNETYVSNIWTPIKKAPQGPERGPEAFVSAIPSIKHMFLAFGNLPNKRHGVPNVIPRPSTKRPRGTSRKRSGAGEEEARKRGGKRERESERERDR